MTQRTRDLEVAAELSVDHVLRMDFVGRPLAYEDDVVRRHVTGYFGDFFGAVVAGANLFAYGVGEFDEAVGHATAGVGL